MAIYLFLQILKFTKYIIKLIEKLSRRHLIKSSDVFVIKGFTVYVYYYLVHDYHHHSIHNHHHHHHSTHNHHHHNPKYNHHQGWTQILCGTSNNHRPGLWMLRISKRCLRNVCKILKIQFVFVFVLHCTKRR